MKSKYLQLFQWIFRFNAWLSAFAFFTLILIIFLLVALKIAEVFHPAFYVSELSFQPLPLLFLVTLKTFFFWRAFSISLRITKAYQRLTDINLHYLHQVRQYLTTIFFISTVLYILELPHVLGPFDDFLRMGPTEIALSSYSFPQLAIYYLGNFFSLDLSGIVSLILILVTFVIEAFAVQNQQLKTELEEVI